MDLDSTQIKAIYFDTQALSEANWPLHPSSRVRRVIDAAARREIPLFIPDAVNIELQRQAEEKLDGALAPLFGQMRFNIRAAIEEYSINVRRTLTRLGIRVVPFTTRTVQELFWMAANGEPPFKRGSPEKPKSRRLMRASRTRLFSSPRWSISKHRVMRWACW